MTLPTLLERLLFPPVRLDLAALRRRLDGRTMLVTGASFGIGEQVARIAGAAGAQVLLVARTRSRLEEVAAGIEADGGTARTYPCEFADGEAVRAKIEAGAEPTIGADLTRLLAG